MGEGEEGGEGEGGIHPHPDIQAVVVLADDAPREREREGDQPIDSLHHNHLPNPCLRPPS